MRKAVPAPVTVIAVLHFVFGGLGVLQNTCGGVMLAAGINQMLVSGGSGPPGSRQHELFQDMQKALQSVPAYYLVQYTNLAGDLLISIIMIVSGVGLLRLQPWGRFLSLLYAILSIGLKVFAAVYAFAFTVPAFNNFIDTHQQIAPEVRMTVTLMKMIVVITPLVLIVYMIYPIIVLIIMLLPSTRAAFQGQTASRDYDDFDEPADVERAD